MKYFIFFVLAIPGNLFAQESDTIDGGPIIVPVELVYDLPYSRCEFDTLIKIHENALFLISDSNLYNYTFISGTKNYIEITISTKKCKCSDCESSENVIIEYANLNSNEPLVIDSLNTKWFSWNSWISPMVIYNFSGKLSKYKNKYSLTLNKYFAYKNPTYYVVETIELKNLQIKP